MKPMLAAVLAVIMILAACGNAPAEQGPRRMETAADADEWAAVLLGEHPEELDGVWLMSAQMEAAMAQGGGFAAFAKQLAALGTAVSVSTARESEYQGYRLYSVPCVFMAQALDIQLFVLDGSIEGIRFGAYSGETETAAASDAFESIELPLPVPPLGELPGILTVPAGEGPFPAVVLLWGSGPFDLDSTIGTIKPFRDIAEGLSEQGIAVYRFSKRTYIYGEETAAKKDATLEDEYLEDAVNAVQLVARQEKIDPERIYVLGHSLGGNAVPAVARELEKAPVKAFGYIMMAASLRPLDVLMREQYDYLYSLLPEVSEEQQAEKDDLFADLDRLRDLDSLTEDDKVANVYSAYWKWLAAYDIPQAAREMTEPVLLLQGEEDYQVTTADFELWKEAVGGRENWRMISYPGLTHLFTAGKKSEGSAAYARDGKVDETVIRDIAAFISDTATAR